jgi:hypothetical protein
LVLDFSKSLGIPILLVLLNSSRFGRTLDLLFLRFLLGTLSIGWEDLTTKRGVLLSNYQTKETKKKMEKKRRGMRKKNKKNKQNKKTYK